MLWRIAAFIDWFLYYRKGKIKYKVWNYGNSHYYAKASDGKITVKPYYGTTVKAAKQMKKEVTKEPALILTKHGYKINEKRAPLE